MWGEGDGFFGLIAGLVRFSPGIVPVPGDGKSRFQPLWIGDLAHVVVLSLERSETISQSYDLGGPTYWTYREITREVLDALGKQRLVIPVPVPLISLVARASELVHLPFPVATDQLRQLKLDTVGPLDGVERAFGFAPRPMNGHLGYLRHRGQHQGRRPAASVRNDPEQACMTKSSLPPAASLLLTRIGWIAAALIIALGAAGLVTALDHRPGSAAPGGADLVGRRGSARPAQIHRG